MGVEINHTNCCSCCRDIKYIIKMKLLIVFATLLVGALCNSHFKMCKQNEDCAPHGCCQGIGHLLWCQPYAKEGEICTITSRFGCGCEPGLVCKRYGSWLLEKCQKVPTVPPPTTPAPPPTTAAPAPTTAAPAPTKDQ